MNTLPARILVIDDEQNLLEMLGELLGDQGHEVILANTGAKGLDRYYSHHPDLALIDLMLPDLSGFDVLKHISSQDEETALIVISGVGSTDHVIEAVRRGAWDFLSKPFANLELVLHAVDQGLEKVRLKRERTVATGSISKKRCASEPLSCARRSRPASASRRICAAANCATGN